MSIEKAAEAIYDFGFGLTKDQCRELARAALPHLLEEPTAAEVATFQQTARGALLGGNLSSTETALHEFVRRRRNAPPEPPEPEQTKDGAALIAAERARQMDVEGWTPEHDDQHDAGELASAAVTYILETVLNGPAVAGTWFKQFWCFEDSAFKLNRDPARNLVKAGALIAAEIDRLQRIPAAPPEPLKGEWENIKDLLFGLSSAGFGEINRRVHEAYRRGARLNQAASVEPLETHTIVVERSDTRGTTTTLYGVVGLKLDGVDVLPKSAAPPVPDPRREALIAAFKDASGSYYPTQHGDAVRNADVALSALDSLKGSQP